MNLEALRRKRVQRLGVKVVGHTGQRRIFFVLDRATRKFHGDIGLWMQYLAFARKQKAYKKISEILTRVLRLHPTKPELWIYAATYAVEERGDMVEARSYMQRGLRFSDGSGKLWMEYARLELNYIAKVVGRRQILGLDRAEKRGGNSAEDGEGLNDDMVALPVITAEDVNPETQATDGMDLVALERVIASPALSGAIPVAIFDAAMKKLGSDEELALAFFDMVSEFDQLPCQANILNHIIEMVQSKLRQTPATLIRFIRQPVIGISFKSAEFPGALVTSFSRAATAARTLSTTQAKSKLGQGVIEWLLAYLEEDDLDPDIRKAIELMLEKAWNQFQADVGPNPVQKAVEVDRLLDLFEMRGVMRIAEPGRLWVSKVWSGELSSAAPQHLLQ